jgi:tetraprenyl-beta-curcumene synthase
MRNPHTNRAALVGMFARAAWTYWTSVYPYTRRELRRLRDRATEIPDHVLRRLALQAQIEKWGDLEGAAAFATFVPSSRRAVTVRALVAFQAAYDYLDTISEQPSPDPAADGHQLHTALLIALGPEIPHHDYYAHHPRRHDNGYLRDIVDTSRTAFSSLPAHAVVAPLAQRGAERIAAYQSINHAARPREALARWGRAQTPSGSDLRWWEACAASGSSLSALALIAAAADPALTTEHAEAIDHAYHPWIGALHTLLDSLIDYSNDTAAGQYNLIEPYGPPAAAADGIRRLSTQALRHARALPNSRQHLLLLAAMTNLYLSAHEATLPHAKPTTLRVLRTTGEATAPSMLVLKLRRVMLRAAENQPPRTTS